jgi:hypothetical protein
MRTVLPLVIAPTCKDTDGVEVIRSGKGKVKALRVTLDSGTVVTVTKLFGRPDSNAKLAKSNRQGVGVFTVGLSLAPHKTAGVGNVCPNATPGCVASCIYTAGYGKGVFANVPNGRKARTVAYMRERAAFLEMLTRDIRNARKAAKAKRARLAVRLNVFSDIPWEKVAPQLFTAFPDVQFYDYTKNASRAVAFALGRGPSNYDLTFSRSETNDDDCLNVLAAGGNVAVVYGVRPSLWKRGERPKDWHGYPVIDGDKTDLRFLDPAGVVVGLYAKGQGSKDRTGFVVRS